MSFPFQIEEFAFDHVLFSTKSLFHFLFIRIYLFSFVLGCSFFCWFASLFFLVCVIGVVGMFGSSKDDGANVHAITSESTQPHILVLQK